MYESKGLQGHKINALATTVWTTLTLEVLLRTRQCRRTIRAYRLLDGADLLACTGADRQPVMSPDGLSKSAHTRRAHRDPRDGGEDWSNAHLQNTDGEAGWAQTHTLSRVRSRCRIRYVRIA